MAERMMPVPVSLIEQAANLLAYGGTRDLDLAGSFRALLSQPTPTAEPMSTEQIGQEYLRLITTPPRIEDMAPGTRFVAEGLGVPGVDHPFEVRMTDSSEQVLYCHLHHTGAQPWYVDPSTIRNVTPPPTV